MQDLEWCDAALEREDRMANVETILWERES